LFDDYITYITELTKGQVEARKSLVSAPDKFELDRAKALIKSFVNEKDILKEKRYAIKLLNKMEEKLIFRLYKLQNRES